MYRVLLIPTILLALIGALCFWQTAGSDPARGNSRRDRAIVVCNADEIKTLDPGKMSWVNDIRVAMALWEGLTAYDPVTLKPVPGMAESWDISPDRKTYTFHLRPGALWSNGDPVTAQDFVFAWRRTITPATGSPYTGLYNVIVGAAGFTTGKGKDPAALGVAAPNPSTLVVNLVAPCGYFLDLCAFPPFYPLNERAMRDFELVRGVPSKGHDGHWTRPPNLVTNGPYLLKTWEFQQYLLLERNPNYWDRAHVLSRRVIVKSIKDSRAALLAYDGGAIDVLTFIPPQFGDDLVAAQAAGKRTDVHYRPVFGTYYYVFNCTKKPLNDKRVRKALALAIDKETLVRDVTHMNQKTLGVIVPPGAIPGYVSPTGLPENVAEAQRLLAEAGYPGGENFPSLEILTTNEISTHQMVAQAIGQMWQKNLGVHTTFRSLESASFREARNSQSFDVARGGWYGDYVDPTTWLDLLRSTDGNNDGKFSDPAYDALLSQAAVEVDPAKRFALLKQAEAMLVHDEFPLIPLYQYGNGLMFDGNKIKGITANVRMLTPLKWIHRSD